MLYLRLWVILLWRILLLVLGLQTGHSDILSLRLEPVKYSNYAASYDDFCFVMELTSSDEENGELVSNVLFTFHVIDVIPLEIDTRRFGGTSKTKGLQSLHMSIKDPTTGNLLSSTRSLRTGITYVELNSRGSQNFNVCFANLVYDSSWSSIDVLEYITITLSTKERLARIKVNSLQDEYNVHAAMDDGMNKISQHINGEPFETLKLTEMEHRNLNESLCGSFVRTFILMVVVLCLPPIILSYYCVKYKNLRKL